MTGDTCISSEKKVSLAVIGAAGVILMLFLTALDQYTKVLALRYLKGQPARTVIPGVLQLKHLENDGAAWGIFSGKTGIFLVLCLLFFAAALILFFRIPKTTRYLPLFAVLFLMLSGSLGNFIDRIRKGSVTDFLDISPLFEFPVFNFADIYIVLSGVLLVLLVCLKYQDDDFAFLSFRKKDRQ